MIPVNFQLRLRKHILLIWMVLISGITCSNAQRYEVGDIIEDFSLIERLSGEPVNLYDFEGKIIFLEWFAYWCPFCQAAAAQIGPGIVDYYQDLSGNPDGVPVMHVGLNLQGNAESSSQNFIDFYGIELVLNDFNRAVASRFQSSNQPIFAIINGIENSPSHEQWELIYSKLGYRDTTHPIEDFRAAIDTVKAAVEIPDFEDYLNGLGVPENQREEHDDPDFDGVPNVFEYLSGTDALDTASSFTPLNKIVTVGEAQYQALEYINNPEATDVTVVVQFSDHPNFGSLNVTVPYSTEVLPNGFEKVVARSGNVLGPGSEFSRLFLNIDESQN